MESSDTELIISGFIREISRLLSDDNIIPTEITSLCLLFYQSYPSKLLIPFTSSQHCTTNLYIIDIDYTNNKLKESAKLTKPIEISRDYDNFTMPLFGPSCFIHNISSILDTKNSDRLDSKVSYDAILCTEQKMSQGGIRVIYDSYPKLILLGPENPNEDHIVLTSSTQYPGVYYETAVEQYNNFFASCGSKHGIIYYGSHVKNFYQLQLANININDVETFDGGINTMNIKHDGLFEYTNNVSLEYIEHEESIFVLKHSESRAKDKCALIDLNNINVVKQMDVDTIIKGNTLSNERFMPSLCHNYNDIYCLSNHGKLSKYDLKIDKWTIIDEGGIISMFKGSDRIPTIWMSDVNIINACIDYCFYRYDLRSGHKKWMTMQDWTTFIQKQLNVDDAQSFSKLNVVFV